MTSNKQIKETLRNRLSELMPAPQINKALAGRTGFTRQYIHRWFNSTLVHDKIENEAVAMLKELSAATVHQFKTIKTT